MFSRGSEEQRLAKRLKEGDKAAAREFYALYGEYLAGICARYITDEYDQKDVLQEAFIQTITHIDNFEYRGAGSLQAWVAKIVVNLSLKFLQQRKRHELASLTFDVADEPELDDPPLSDVPPDVIHRLVSQLPTGYRTVLNLYVLEGKSHREIAQLLDIAESTSSSQLHRAKNLLARMIQQYIDKKPPRQ